MRRSLRASSRSRYPGHELLSGLLDALHFHVLQYLCRPGRAFIRCCGILLRAGDVFRIGRRRRRLDQDTIDILDICRLINPLQNIVQHRIVRCLNGHRRGGHQEIGLRQALHLGHAGRIGNRPDIHVLFVEVGADIGLGFVQHLLIVGLRLGSGVLADVVEQKLELVLQRTVHPLVDRGKHLKALFDQRQRGSDLPGVARVAGTYYVKYGFFPHPEGKFYDLGLGLLLACFGFVVVSLVFLLFVVFLVVVAGGGFIGSGARLQGTNRSTTIRLAPGEWKPVNVPGDQLRNAMVERTVPQVSQITFQVLELLLGAAQDISSTKDVLTGDASNTGQVGTTLALIEQGLQMITAIYKRVYRSLKDEFQLLFDNIGKYATAETQADYQQVLDEPQADIRADFNEQDMDIRPVSDPTSVTKMQSLAKANFLMSTAPMAVQAANNPVLHNILKRVYEAADIEDVDGILIQTPPPPPNPKDIASAKKDSAAADESSARAAQILQDMEAQRVEKAAEQFMAGISAAG